MIRTWLRAWLDRHSTTDPEPLSRLDRLDGIDDRSPAEVQAARYADTLRDSGWPSAEADLAAARYADWLDRIARRGRL